MTLHVSVLCCSNPRECRYIHSIAVINHVYTHLIIYGYYCIFYECAMANIYISENIKQKQLQQQTPNKK